MGMAVAPDHDRRPLGHPAIALAQLDAVALRQSDQLLQRAMTQPGVGRVGDRLWLHRGIDHHPLEIAGRQRPHLVRIPPVWAALPVSAGITDASMFD